VKFDTKARRTRRRHEEANAKYFFVSSSSLRAFVSLGPIAALMCILCVSCVDKSNSTTRPLTARERQDQALRDPFGYGPQPTNRSTDMPTVTGGKMGEFNRKEFDRDVDRVFNP
jgi:hypothetical protein